MIIFRGARGAEYKVIDESKPSRTRTWEAEKSCNACVRVYMPLGDAIGFR